MTTDKKLTPEQYAARATMEQAFKVHAAKTPPDVDSLRGCLMMAVNMAKTLNLSLKDLQALTADEHMLWEEYIAVKLRVRANRAAKK